MFYYNVMIMWGIGYFELETFYTNIPSQLTNNNSTLNFVGN